MAVTENGVMVGHVPKGICKIMFHGFNICNAILNIHVSCYYTGGTIQGGPVAGGGAQLVVCISLNTNFIKSPMHNKQSPGLMTSIPNDF